MPVQPVLRFWGVAMVLLACFCAATYGQQSSVRAGADMNASDEAPLLKALETRGSLDVVGMPLRDFVQLLNDQFQVQFVLRPQKLEEAAIGLDAPVSVRAKNLPLRSLLRMALSELELEFSIADDAIVISTPDDLHSPANLITRVYPVRDLVTLPDGKQDYVSIIEMMTTTLDPASWDEVGGPASVAPLETAGALTISHHWEAHRKIEQLLAALRQVKESQGLASAPKTESGSSVRMSRRTPPAQRRYIGGTSQSWQVPHLHAGE